MSKNEVARLKSLRGKLAVLCPEKGDTCDTCDTLFITFICVYIFIILNIIVVIIRYNV